MKSNQSLRDPPGRGRRRVGPQPELEEPILAELFSVERLEQHAQTLAAAQAVTDAPRRGHAVAPRIAENGRVLVASYRVLAVRSRTNVRSRRPPNGSSTTFPSSTNSSARSATTCPRTTTASSPSWPKAISRVTRGSWVWPGLTSRTRTAASTPRACGAWCTRTRRWSR